MSKQKGQDQIKMCDNNGDSFIAILHNALLAPDICGRLFSIIMLMNLRHTCFFHKRFCMVYFAKKEKQSVTLPHSAKRKHTIKKMSKSKKLAPRKKIAFGLLRHRLGLRSIRSLMARDPENI